MKFSGERVIRQFDFTSKSFLRQAFTFLAVVAVVGLAAIGASAQQKSEPLSKVVRLNRAPVNKEVLKVELPKPAVVTLPNGLTVLLLENHKLPTVAFSLWIRPGQLADPNDLPGLASFTADMLKEGTARRTSEQIATEVDSLGASLDAGSRFGASYTSVTASGLIDSAPQILDLMSDVVLHPAFPADELAKYKQRALADLEQNISSPGFLAQQAFRKVLYGEPPLSVTSATKESVQSVTSEELRRFHDRHYLPGNSIFGATGDFKTDDMKAMIEKYFGGWTGGAEPPMSLPKTTEAQPSKITLVDRPGSVQTYIISGDRGIRRADPEFYALTVMNRIVGGGPQARLFLDLREAHGYTYGAFSSFSSDIYSGAWAAVSPVRTPVTDGAMTQFVYEFKKINDEPVPQEELSESERAIIAGFALSLEQPQQILNAWLTVKEFGLPMDYWDKYPGHIGAVTAADVQAVAKKYVDLAHLQWVCVGDRKQIESVLKKYGPVTVVDATGKPEN
ncbi:MAG TPA: pitrilysin family protein [Candidatus Acidoferrales bacterium]|nr:pitrilysin family protein [Candidatus Acidoferrales bacterium]